MSAILAGLGPLAAGAGFQTLTGAAQEHEANEIATIFKSGLMRYLLIFVITWLITKRWRIGLLVLIGWILLKAAIKYSGVAKPSKKEIMEQEKTEKEQQEKFAKAIADAIKSV